MSGPNVWSDLIVQCSCNTEEGNVPCPFLYMHMNEVHKDLYHFFSIPYRNKLCMVWYCFMYPCLHSHYYIESNELLTISLTEKTAVVNNSCLLSARLEILLIFLSFRYSDISSYIYISALYEVAEASSCKILYRHNSQWWKPSAERRSLWQRTSNGYVSSF